VLVSQGTGDLGLLGQQVEDALRIHIALNQKGGMRTRKDVIARKVARLPSPFRIANFWNLNGKRFLRRSRRKSDVIRSNSGLARRFGGVAGVGTQVVRCSDSGGIWIDDHKSGKIGNCYLF
jgi:hypothetical protein